MSLHTLATVTLPARCPDPLKALIESSLKEKYPNFDVVFQCDPTIQTPKVTSIDPRGADLGKIDGSSGIPFEAAAFGITREATRLFLLSLPE